jgi:hypothetical protein
MPKQNMLAVRNDYGCSKVLFSQQINRNAALKDVSRALAQVRVG